MNTNITNLVNEAVHNRTARGLSVNKTYTNALKNALIRFRAKHIRPNVPMPSRPFKRIPNHQSLWTPRKPAGEHQFSTVFMGTVTRKLQRWMRALQFDNRIPFTKTNVPSLHKKIVLKIQTFTPHLAEETWTQFINRCFNEVKIQTQLNVPGNPARVYVPHLYLGGLVQGTRKFVIIMVAVPGRPLESIPPRQRNPWKPLVLQAYRMLKKAGVHHGDLHGGNILVDPTTKKVYIIDFGSAVSYGREKSKPGLRKLKAVTYAQGQQLSQNALQMLILFGGYQNLFNEHGRRRSQ